MSNSKLLKTIIGGHQAQTVEAAPDTAPSGGTSGKPGNLSRVAPPARDGEALPPMPDDHGADAVFQTIKRGAAEKQAAVEREKQAVDLMERWKDEAARLLGENRELSEHNRGLQNSLMERDGRIRTLEIERDDAYEKRTVMATHLLSATMGMIHAVKTTTPRAQRPNALKGLASALGVQLDDDAKSDNESEADHTD